MMMVFQNLGQERHTINVGSGGICALVLVSRPIYMCTIYMRFNCLQILLLASNYIIGEIMKVISLNVNDFGGCNEHLEEYKKEFKYQAFRKWDKLDKRENIQGIFDFLSKINPEVIVLQEFDINSREANGFIAKMQNMGYELKAESPSKRPSMTVMFIKNDFIYKEVKTCHVRRCMRAYAVNVEDYIIYGIHVPPIYDELFWDEIEKLWSIYQKHKLVMIGDINTINFHNNKRLNNLLSKSIDVWNAKGNEGKVSVPGDHVIISTNIGINTVEIEKEELVCKYTDHPAIVLTLN